MADTRDLKSRAHKTACRFESGYPYHFMDQKTKEEFRDNSRYRDKERRLDPRFMNEPKNGLEDFGRNLPERPQTPRYPEDPTASYLDGDDRADERIKEFDKRVTHWTEVARGLYISSPETIPTMGAGVYKYVRYNADKCGFQKQPINVDELLVMPDSLSDKVLNEIQDFLNKADKYKYYNFLHRRGYMFYGPHGSGKSSLVQQILKKIVDQDGIVLLCEHPSLLEAGLSDLRRVEKDRFIVCLFEDIDALIQRYGEKEILAVLDGESQVNKVLNIATTNYPETLDKRIIGRPRRFDRVLRIDWPSAEMRKHFFKHKLKIEDTELATWVNATDRFSFAACAELVISVKCLDMAFEEALSILRSLMDSKPSSHDYETTGGPVGFGGAASRLFGRVVWAV